MVLIIVSGSCEMEETFNCSFSIKPTESINVTSSLMALSNMQSVSVHFNQSCVVNSKHNNNEAMIHFLR